MSWRPRGPLRVTALVVALLLEGALPGPVAQEATIWVFARVMVTQRPASFQLGDLIYYSQVFPVKEPDWRRIGSGLAGRAAGQVRTLAGPGWHVEGAVSHASALREAEERRRRNIIEDQDAYRIHVRYFDFDYAP
jgi:hypothetical protein